MDEVRIAPPGAHRAATQRPIWWHHLKSMPSDRRMRVLSLLGAMVLTVLVATALAVAMLRPSTAPAIQPPSERDPGSATQPGVPASPQPKRPSPTPRRPSPTPAATVQLTARYQASETYTGGYIGSITVKVGPAGLDKWTAVIELPEGAQVTSAWDRMNFRQQGRTVVFTPGEAHRALAASTEFTFSFQVNDGSETFAPQTCQVNEVRCTGLTN